MSSFNKIYLNIINTLQAFYRGVEANVEARNIFMRFINRGEGSGNV